MNRATLIIGNELNRSHNISPSWNELLEKISNSSKDVIDYLNATMGYEYIEQKEIEKIIIIPLKILKKKYAI